jgi:hypothetical protein
VSRIVAITSGYDWNDASCEHVCIPDGMDLAKEDLAYNEWKKQRQVPEPYKTFIEWLQEFRGVIDADIEHYEEI